MGAMKLLKSCILLGAHAGDLTGMSNHHDKKEAVDDRVDSGGEGEVLISSSRHDRFVDDPTGL